MFSSPDTKIRVLYLENVVSRHFMFHSEQLMLLNAEQNCVIVVTRAPYIGAMSCQMQKTNTHW